MGPRPGLASGLSSNLRAVSEITTRSMRQTKVFAPCWSLRLEICVSQTAISGTAVVRLALISLDLSKPGPFLREPFKTIEVRAAGQVIILIRSAVPLFGVMPRKSAKFKRSDSAQSARATKAREDLKPSVMQWLVLFRGMPYRGPAVCSSAEAFLPYPTLRTSSITLASHFPQLKLQFRSCGADPITFALSRSGPPGGSTAQFTTFQE